MDRRGSHYGFRKPTKYDYPVTTFVLVVPLVLATVCLALDDDDDDGELAL